MIRIGTAGWGVHSSYAACFPDSGTHLQRYAAVLNAAEINSSFYRPHKRSTYERWAASTPEAFSFAVKVPKAATHDARLVATEAIVDRFLEEAHGLGPKLGALLVQLPPSLAFAPEIAAAFFAHVRSQHEGVLACEPRHSSWFTEEVDALLTEHRVARVAADPPAGSPCASEPGGWERSVYYRLHGSPRIYYSDYEDAALNDLARRLGSLAGQADVWCIFDNTAAFAALGNAVGVMEKLANP